MKPTYTPVALAALLLSLAAAPGAAQTHRQGVYATGDNVQIDVLNIGGGSTTDIDSNGDGARISAETLGGGHTRIFAHGAADLHVQNDGNDRTFYVGNAVPGAVPTVMMTPFGTAIVLYR
ncbi:MAG: hypothetical protein KDK12_18280 [Rhodobacteraceae bacterium]|nr:hypothetical protein [Paracoccaceae bacterium]